MPTECQAMFLGTGDTAVNKLNKNACFLGLHILVNRERQGEYTNKQEKYKVVWSSKQIGDVDVVVFKLGGQ